MNQGNKKSTKVLATIIVALLVFVGIGAIVIGSMNANHIKKEEPAVESSEVSSSSSSKKETSKSERNENTANTINIKSDEGTKVVPEVEIETNQTTPEKPKVDKEYLRKSIEDRTPIKEGEIYTPDGELRYATTNTDMIAMRKLLLHRWGEYADAAIEWNMVRLNEQKGGFGVSAGGVNWGFIEDKGNNKFDFIKKEGEGAFGEYVVKGTETVPYQ